MRYSVIRNDRKNNILIFHLTVGLMFVKANIVSLELGLNCFIPEQIDFPFNSFYS